MEKEMSENSCYVGVDRWRPIFLSLDSVTFLSSPIYDRGNGELALNADSRVGLVFNRLAGSPRDCGTGAVDPLEDQFQPWVSAALVLFSSCGLSRDWLLMRQGRKAEKQRGRQWYRDGRKAHEVIKFRVCFHEPET